VPERGAGPGTPANKRLKLAGDDRFNGIGVLCPGGHELTFNNHCALWASRPQLKRDPLGGGLLYALSAGTVSRCTSESLAESPTSRRLPSVPAFGSEYGSDDVMGGGAGGNARGLLKSSCRMGLSGWLNCIGTRRLE